MNNGDCLLVALHKKRAVPPATVYDAFGVFGPGTESGPRNSRRPCSSDKVLLWISITLLFFGLAMGYSASMVMAREVHGSSSYFFMKQAVFAAGALLLMFAAMKIDYRKLNSARFLFPALAVALAALMTVFHFVPVNGACRWIRIGAVSLQPSEFVKVLLIIFV